MPTVGARVRPYIDSDLSAVTSVHSASFPRQLLSTDWISCNAAAYPRARYFVAEVEGEVIGYILWLEKSGFRKDVVLELEQIAVVQPHRRQGVAETLIRESLPTVAHSLEERGATISSILVTTRADNDAVRLYERVLGARVTATIPGLFSADEVVMVANSRDAL